MTEPLARTTRPVLVLHAPADAPFVRGFLVPALGPEARGEQVIHARDLATVAIPELEQALHGSGVTIAVITPAFLTNPWSRLSELLASDSAIERDLDVIPLVLEDCALPLHIKAKVGLDFRSPAGWDREIQRLREYLARPPPVETPLPCPYPGMRPFEAADASYFHGRDAEIDAVIALVIAGEREIYLVGPSGSGKSSLIRAGVLPRLAAQPDAAERVVRTMRPGDAPVRRLAECLEAGADAAPDAAAIAAWSARHPGARLVVFVDQLEELFTLAARPEQDRFAEALRVLRDDARCLVVLALRADFYAELLQSQLWLDARRQHVDLPPLRGAALRAAIELPARALEVYLEAGLIERLLADAAGEPGVLPLLQETLVQLWGRRRRRLLTLSDYEALGEGGRSGLAVAISSRADRCLREMTPSQATIARHVLLRLVSFGEGRPNTRRRQTRAALAAGESPGELDAVLRALVAARLLIMDGDNHADDDRVDLCHEVLITAWPPFAAWVEARRADEQRRRQIQASADEWIARGRGAGGLLDDGELAAALAWRRTGAARELGESPEVTALVDTSRRALVRARWRLWIWIACVCAGVAVFAAVTVQLSLFARDKAQVARVEQSNAQRMLGEQFRELGRQAIVAEQFQRAIPYLVAARAQGVDDSSLKMMFRTANTEPVVLALRHDRVITAVFSDDGTRIATAGRDGTARLWNAASGAAVMPALVHPTMITRAALSPDGKRLVTVGDSNTAWLWDLTASPSSHIVLHHAGRVNMASFSSDGDVVATASEDKTARLWDARTGAARVLLEHDAAVADAVLSPDGSRVVTTVREGMTAGIWDARTGARVAQLIGDPWFPADDVIPEAHHDFVQSARFSPDGSRIVTASADNTALIWDAATGKTVGVLQHGIWVTHAVFSPDGERIATADRAGRVRLWSSTGASASGQLVDDLVNVVLVDYSRDGARILAACDDKTIRIWEVARARTVATIALEAGASGAALNRDGTRVVTASADGLARVWDVRARAPRVLEAVSWVFDAAYSPDGTRIATSDANGVRLWTTSGTRVADLRPELGTVDVVFDRDGRQIAAIGMDGSARTADVATATMRPFQREKRRDPTGGATPRRLVGHMLPRGSFSPDGRRFATLAGVNAARIWDTASRQAVTPPLVHDGPALMIRFSPDGRRVVTASEDGTARVWDADSGAPIGPVLVHRAPSWVTGAVFSPDGARIATTCSDGNARLWDASSGALQAVLTGHAGMIISAVFSPDGALLLTHSDDQSARIWNVATGLLAAPPLEHAAQVNSAVFSADSAQIVTSSGTFAQIWDTRTGRLLAPPFVHSTFVLVATLSPDGNSLLTVAHDAVRIWEVGLDARSLDDWRRVSRDGSFPQLAGALEQLTPAAHATR